MSSITNVTTLYEQFKTDIEKQEFIKAQHITITDLLKKNKQLQDENAHLKELVSGAVPLIAPAIAPVVEKIVVSPEEALLDSQIEAIQIRSYGKELSLEDVKKLDILLKNKKILKDEQKAILINKPSPLSSLSHNELLQLVQVDNT